VRARRRAKRTAAARRSTLRSGILTGVSSLVLSASAAVAAALLAQKFGRDAATDGFLAAYGVYVTLTLAAQALRLTAVPELTRTGGAAAGSYAAAILLVGIPAAVAAWLFADPLGELLTGRLPDAAAKSAAEALPWLVPAAVGQLLAALAAAALAARDRFGAAAIGFSVGGVLGLVVFAVLADQHGLVSLAWGLALNAVVALAVPLVALAPELRSFRFDAVPRRLLLLAEAAAVPLALQTLYVLSLRAASGLDVGDLTSFSYAYFFAAVLVAATATSFSVVATAELTRRDVDPSEAVAHVVHGAWLSLAAIAPVAGVFALAGGEIARTLLGDAFAGDVGAELGRLVVALAPWTVAAVGFSLAFPLLYVLERSRVLVPVAIGVVLLYVPLVVALRAALGLEGIALALGLATAAVLAALLGALSRRALTAAAVAFARVAAAVGFLVAVTFGVLSLLAPDALAAAVGLVAYAVLLAAVRPSGLREAWGYVRELR
jgi:O-antigen/teichoic acid export membrane protein